MPTHVAVAFDCELGRDIVLIENHDRHRDCETPALKMFSKQLASAHAVDPR